MRKASWALALAASAAAGLLLGMAKAAEPAGAARPAVQWEYRLEPKVGTPMEPAARGEHQYQKFFEAMGKDGWEYTGSFGGTSPGPSFTLVFRRPKP